MRKTIVAVSLAVCAGFLGGCAGGGMNGESLLPTASQLHSDDSTGGGIILKKASRMHTLDSTGGGIILLKKHSRMHQLDSTGGGIILKGQKG